MIFNVLCSGNSGCCQIFFSPPKPALRKQCSMQRCLPFSISPLMFTITNCGFNNTPHSESTRNSQCDSLFPSMCRGVLRVLLETLQGSIPLLSQKKVVPPNSLWSHILRNNAAPNTVGSELCEWDRETMRPCIFLKAFMALESSFCKGNSQWVPKRNVITVNERAYQKGHLSQLKY